MATLSDSLVSSSARSLPIRVRPDLTAKKQRYLGKTYWIVKDPIGLKYYRFQEEEYAILNMLDGSLSMDEIKDKFQKEFPPQKITLEELSQFIGSLHRSGLILTGVHDQGYQLYERAIKRRRREMVGAMSNILCIRFKGFDPERLLNWMYPFFAWIYHPFTMTLSLVMMISALLLVMTHFDTFYSKLPSFNQFFTPENGLWLALVLGMTKVIHEFGHGLTCKHFGGECHEMGVMILVLTPCLYCNVSDSWMLPSKWRRAAIGFAGIFVEVWLASFATFLWWYTNPGLLNNICLNIMFISSVSTIIFNANPLLRYDGYYVLSDLMEIPNMRQKATSILSRKAGEWFLGLEYPDDPFLPQRNQALFALYAVAAAMYRWVVTLSITMFLLQVFKPYGLQVLGYAIVAMSMFGLFVMPLWKVGKFFYVPGRLEKVKKLRFYLSLLAVCGLISFVFFAKLPFRIFVPVEIQYDQGDTVYVLIPGTLMEIHAEPGDYVKKGQLIAVLQDTDLDQRIMELKREEQRLAAQLAYLPALSRQDPTAEAQIPIVQKALDSARKELEQKVYDKERLKIVASRDGVLVQAPLVKKIERDGLLPNWDGTPFQQRNLGAFMRTGDAFCIIGDPLKMKATLVVTQSQKNFIQKGQRVDINLNECPFHTFTGETTDLATEELKAVSPRLSNKNKGEVSTMTEQDGTEKPQITSYKVDVPLDNSDGLMAVGLTGQAKIYAAPQTIAFRIWRIITETINFKI
ncbi:MAG: hemolysin D [Planctomycetia bacterium]|nr:hemolysin D [Planctomycetia bacterium]